MMNNRLIARESLILVLLCSCTTLAFAAAEAEESGRDMAMDFVDEGSLVAGSFLDAESGGRFFRCVRRVGQAALVRVG